MYIWSWHNFVGRKFQGSTKYLLEVINEFACFADYKINYKNKLYFSTLAVNNPKNKSKNTNQFTIVLQRIKYTEKIIKGVQELSTVNHKTLF